MKVKENMHPDEVMKAYREQTPDKPVRVVMRQTHTQEPMEWQIIPEPLWNWAIYDYAIIDEEPELTAEWWDGFDYPFFNQYGGLRCHYGASVMGISLKCAPDDPEDLTPTESPFYHWQGGKQPVPDNCRVEVIRRFTATNHTNSANQFDWEHYSEKCSGGNDIIAFRITGKIIN